MGSKWLATILAARRAAKVAGWITLLTVSMIATISVKNPGAPQAPNMSIILFH